MSRNREDVAREKQERLQQKRLLSLSKLENDMQRIASELLACAPDELSIIDGTVRRLHGATSAVLGSIKAQRRLED